MVCNELQGSLRVEAGHFACVTPQEYFAIKDFKSLKPASLCKTASHLKTASL